MNAGRGIGAARNASAVSNTTDTFLPRFAKYAAALVHESNQYGKFCMRHSHDVLLRRLATAHDEYRATVPILRRRLHGVEDAFSLGSKH